ncbi:MAG TPA: hypothetical protein VIJ28_06315 [Chloroflexota bacterium]|jgi:predicted lipoprotein with Yx(FWY)xxD motif
MRLSSRFISVLAAPLLLAGAAGAYASNHSQAAPALVSMAPGHLLVNAKGLTLYVFAADSKNKSVCSGQCAKFWPPTLVANGVTVPKSMTGVTGTFGEIMRADGTHQLTFDGAPLYTFLEDKKAGDLNGQGLIASGGYWWAVVVPGAAAPAASSPTPAAKSGY